MNSEDEAEKAIEFTLELIQVLAPTLHNPRIVGMALGSALGALAKTVAVDPKAFCLAVASVADGIVDGSLLMDEG